MATRKVISNPPGAQVTRGHVAWHNNSKKPNERDGSGKTLAATSNCVPTLGLQIQASRRKPRLFFGQSERGFTCLARNSRTTLASKVKPKTNINIVTTAT